MFSKGIRSGAARLGAPHKRFGDGRDVVWIGRYRRPEGEEYSGGFLQYSLVSGEVSGFRVGSVIRLFKRWEGNLDIASDGDLYFKGKHR